MRRDRLPRLHGGSCSSTAHAEGAAKSGGGGFGGRADPHLAQVPARECDPGHGRSRIPLSSSSEIVPFEQEMDMNEEPHERELSVDELDLVSGGGAIAPLTERAGLVGREPAHGRQGIVDDSV